MKKKNDIKLKAKLGNQLFSKRKINSEKIALELRTTIIKLLIVWSHFYNECLNIILSLINRRWIKKLAHGLYPSYTYHLIFNYSIILLMHTNLQYFFSWLNSTVFNLDLFQVWKIQSLSIAQFTIPVFFTLILHFLGC